MLELRKGVADGKNYSDVMHKSKIIINEWVETAQELGRHIPMHKGRLVFGLNGE